MWIAALALAGAFAGQSAAASGMSAAPAGRSVTALLQLAQAEGTARKQRRGRKSRAKPKESAVAPTVAKPAPTVAKPVARATPATAAAPVKPMSPVETYAAMTVAERSAIQTDLVWTGYYDGIVDGNFGDRSVAAVRAFQKRSNAKETGVLNPHERELLAGLAKRQQEQVGWRVVDDKVTGARLGLPAKLAPQASRGNDGARWASTSGDIQIETFRIKEPGATLTSVAAKQRTEADRKIDYDVQRPDFFVLSGTQGPKKFYVRAHGRGEEVRGVTVLYDPAKQEQMKTVVVAISNSFVPFGRNGVATGLKAARSKVEYSTGVVASTAGDILADRTATDGCHIIRIAGLDPAERIAEDAGSGLALLRVNGARGLHAAVFSGVAAGASALTLVGIADPRAQGGGGAITTPAARLTGDGLRLEQMPTAGFAGAAAVSPDGRVRGVVRMKPQTIAGSTLGGNEATLVPMDAVAHFLHANGVAAAAGPSSLKDTKAATVRVICVRP